MATSQSSTLKVIALISGGKDSLFSILHCIANGHQVVALANLYPGAGPPEPSQTSASQDIPEDIDSYMYQTVGHNVIPLYEEALEIALYREEIRGSATNSDKIYHPGISPFTEVNDDEDETESMLRLLQRIIEIHPGVNAVSTGAILSVYQRTRVESVATRLGLVPLSYLWQYPYLPPATETSLLADMEALGQDARIIKCASGGLDASFLWENVASGKTASRLIKVMGRYGPLDSGAVLGEGGEFETLAIDGPAPLWKKRIHVNEEHTKVVRSGGGAVYLKISRATLVDKRSLQEDSSQGMVHPRIPDVLDASSTNLLLQLQDNIAMESVAEPVDAAHHHNQIAGDFTWRTSRSNTMLHIWNMISRKGIAGVEDQMNDIAEKLKTLLHQECLSPDNISFVNIYLRSMQSFPAINKIYGRLFSLPNPAARVTIGLGDALSATVEVMLSMGIWLGSRNSRDGLHVQSRSYWAPANIGPYSQAISVPVTLMEDPDSTPAAKFVYCAGQIPLVPASMERVSTEKHGASGDFQMQTALSLQHFWRVGMAMKVHWWAYGIAFISGGKIEEIQQKAWTACRAWTWRHAAAAAQVSDMDDSNDDNVDLWAERYGSSETRRYQPAKTRCKLPDYGAVLSQSGEMKQSPLLIVQVGELPRDCEVEWTGVGVAHGRVVTDVCEGGEIRVEECTLKEEKTGLVQVSFSNDLEDQKVFDHLKNMIQKQGSWLGMNKEERTNRRILQATVYTDRNLNIQTLPNVELVPCQSVWGFEGRRVAAGAILRFEPRTLPVE